MLVLNLAHMAGSLAGGFLIDRLGPRKVIGGAAALAIGVSIGAQFVGRNIPVFMVFAGLVGFIIAIGFSGFDSFARFLEETREGLARVNSLMKIAGYTAVIVGPAIGALVVTRFATQRVFFLTAIGATLAAVAMYFTRERLSNGRFPVGEGAHDVVRQEPHEEPHGEPHDVPRDEPGEDRHPIWEAVEGARLLFTVPSLRLYGIIGIMMWFSFGAFDALESLYYKDVVGVGVEWMGWANTAVGAGLLLGALLLTRVPARYITTTLLASFVVFEGLASILYVGTHSIVWVMAGAFLLGIGFGLAEPLMPTLIQSDAPFHAVGRVQGALQFFRVGSALLPLALAPGLAEVFGVQGVLVGASALTVVLVAFVMPSARRIDLAQKASRHIERIDPLTAED